VFVVNDECRTSWTVLLRMLRSTMKGLHIGQCTVSNWPYLFGRVIGYLKAVFVAYALLHIVAMVRTWTNRCGTHVSSGILQQNEERVERQKGLTMHERVGRVHRVGMEVLALGAMTCCDGTYLQHGGITA